MVLSELLIHGLLAWLAGIALNFTPCVLPVIPFKLQLLLRGVERDSRARLLSAMALLAGSWALFLPLGGLMALMSLHWGQWFQASAFVLALALLLLAGGLAMLTDWSPPLPQWLYRLPGGRYSGAFGVGLLGGILSTPCTGPFLGAVLGYSLTQSMPVTLVLFAAVGTGLASPYIAVLIAPGLLDRLPHGGLIGVYIKTALALVLLAGGLFYLSPFLPGWLSNGLWGLWVLGGLSWGIRSAFRPASLPVRLAPATGVAVVTLLGGLLALPGSAALTWQPYSQQALARSQADNRPALIEFTADWCASCKVLERTVYGQPEVAAAAKQARLTPLQVDMSAFNNRHRQLLNRFNGQALPYAVLLDENGAVLDSFDGMFSENRLVDALHKIRKNQ